MSPVHLIIAIALATLPASSENEKPVYRCLAPFVWTLDNEREPKNLFEAFLSGPFDRVEVEEVTGEELLEEGWNLYFDGDKDGASRFFREVWQREERPEALFFLGLTAEEEAFAKVFLSEALGKLPPGSPHAEMAEVASRNLAAGLPIRSSALGSAWWEPHSFEQELRLWRIEEELDGGDERHAGYRPLIWQFLESKPAWMLPRLRFAGSSGEPGLIRVELEKLDPTTAGPGAILAAIELAREYGFYRIAVACARVAVDRGLAGHEEALSRLAWSLGQEQVGKQWADQGGGWPEVKDMVVDRISRAEEAAAGGDLRAALFELDSELAGAVNSSIARAQLLAAVAPILEKAGRSAEGWAKVEPLVVPSPVPEAFKRMNETKLSVLDGGDVDVAAPTREGNLLLFYSGIGCPACQVELQAFRELAPSFDEFGIDIIAVCPQPVPQVRDALAATGQDFPFLFASDPALASFRATKVYDEFENYPLHGAVLVGNEGEILFTVRGYAPVSDAQTVFNAMRRRWKDRE